jgi:hypothetical protein
MSKSPPIVLEYGRQSPLWRRRITRRAIAAMLCIAVGFVTYRYHTAIWQQAQLLYWQRQCLNYSPPADLVVYDEIPGKSHPLVVESKTEILYPDFPLCPDVAGPKCLTEFLNLTTFRPYAREGATLFVHGIKATSGTVYLIIAHVYYIVRTGRSETDPSFHREFRAAFEVVRPATIFSPPIDEDGEELGIWVKNFTAQTNSPPHYRILPGQTDTADPSHFLIPCELDGDRDNIDVTLDDQQHYANSSFHFCLHLNSQKGKSLAYYLEFPDIP